MSVIDQLQILTFIYALGFCVPIVQVFALRRIFKSRSWLIGSLAFLALGGKQVYGFIRLPATLQKAQAAGYRIPEHLDGEQILSTVWAFTVLGLFIAWLATARRDLRNIGY